MSKFWWSENDREIEFIGKGELTYVDHKNEGGLGFRTIIDFNEAFHANAKQVWRLQ